jgi:hypothetical protein
LNGRISKKVSIINKILIAENEIGKDKAILEKTFL